MVPLSTYSQDEAAVALGQVSYYLCMVQPKSCTLPVEHLWRDLRTAAHRCFPSNLMEFERICQEEWDKVAKYRCRKFVET